MIQFEKLWKSIADFPCPQTSFPLSPKHTWVQTIWDRWHFKLPFRWHFCVNVRKFLVEDSVTLRRLFSNCFQKFFLNVNNESIGNTGYSQQENQRRYLNSNNSSCLVGPSRIFNANIVDIKKVKNHYVNYIPYSFYTCRWNIVTIRHFEIGDLFFYQKVITSLSIPDLFLRCNLETKVPKSIPSEFSARECISKFSSTNEWIRNFHFDHRSNRCPSWLKTSFPTWKLFPVVDLLFIHTLR